MVCHNGKLELRFTIFAPIASGVSRKEKNNRGFQDKRLYLLGWMIEVRLCVVNRKLEIHLHNRYAHKSDSLRC